MTVVNAILQLRQETWVSQLAPFTLHSCRQLESEARCVCFLTLSLPLTHSQHLMLPVPLTDEDTRFYISWRDVWNYLKPRHWKLILLLESLFLSNSPFVLKNFFVEKIWPSSFSAFLKVFKICSAMSPEKQTSNITSVSWNTAWNLFLVCLYRIQSEDLWESRLNYSMKDSEVLPFPKVFLCCVSPQTIKEALLLALTLKKGVVLFSVKFPPIHHIYRKECLHFLLQ